MWELNSSQFFNLLSVNMIRKCTSAGDDRGKKRQKTTQPRLNNADWFIRFAWLIHDNKSIVFRCKVCVHAKAKNVLVTGKDCAKSKKDNLAKHEISADHRRSALLPKRQMDFVTVNDHAKSAIIAHMRTVLTQAKHCQLRMLSYKEAFKIWTLKEQRPGFTGLVKRVDSQRPE